MDSPVDTLQQFVAQRPQVQRWLVAYSGGLDSTVLLHCLARLKLTQPLLAIHVHHNLSPRADSWQAHCRATCAALGITFHTANVQLTDTGKGLEDAARTARYRVFKQLLQVGDGLLLAHHRDDQAETLLLRLLRGSGPKGLAAMPEQRPLGRGNLYRPWLGLERAQLLQLAQQWGIDWVEDESNLSQDFDRNYLRHQVLPALQQRWPGFSQRWQQSARLCGQYDALAEQVAAQDLQLAEPRPERCGASIDLPVVKALDPFRRGNLLRHWIASLGLEMPEQVHLQEIETQLINAAEPDVAEVRWGRLALRCYRQRVYAIPQWREPAPAPRAWSGAEPVHWGCWQLSLQPVNAGGFSIPAAGFTLARRQPGERCQPSWRNHSQTLKKLLQEVGLEPWLRDQVPILRASGSDAIVAVGDLWVCRDALVEQGPGYRLQWCYRPRDATADHSGPYPGE
ncbi:MAG: tRNA lysidine(34) synthetase TilS [Gammaproteobacteria bacterium]|nr:tRNA lysidine(34) synthetase TilS [Gammaproteobacteria bacterium]